MGFFEILALPLAPEEASSMAPEVDRLALFMLLFSAFVSLGIAAAIVYFAIRYRRRPGRAVGAPIEGSTRVELLWIGIPTLIALFMFGWGAQIYVKLATPPPDAMEIYVVAKQWMWRFQHPDGQKEIDELHVPVGRDVVLILATEDVIHSFSVPAFRIKADVVPGRYRTVWFRATRPGVYPLYCAEFCGTSHSAMTGSIVALEPARYQAWQSTGVATGTLASAGEKLFEQLACNTCHRGDTQGRGPVLTGLYGKSVPLRGGGAVIADEAYLRESILAPEAKIVAGFDPIMPVFNGLLGEEQVLQLVAYIRSLGGAPGRNPRPASEAP